MKHITNCCKVTYWTFQGGFFFSFRCVWLDCCLKLIFLLFQVSVNQQSSHVNSSSYIELVFSYLCQCFSDIRAKQKGNAVYEVMVIKTLCLIQQQVTTYKSIKLVTISAPSNAAIWDVGFHGSWLVLCLSLTIFEEKQVKEAYCGADESWLYCMSEATSLHNLQLRHMNMCCWVFVAGLLVPFRRELLSAFCWLVLLGGT